MELDFVSSLSDNKIEYAYGQAIRAQERNDRGFAETGMRAARARDPKLLKALERMAESTYKLQEAQLGRSMRSPDATFGESKGTTEHQLVREAYRMADIGTPLENFMWVYGAAAWLCGYNL
jgi:hypothetical protein